jgi:uncharacterized protein DUF2188
MAVEIARDVFLVVQRTSGWSVEHEGEQVDNTDGRDEAVTSATRRARARSESGHPSRVIIEGETGYFRR